MCPGSNTDAKADAAMSLGGWFSSPLATLASVKLGLGVKEREVLTLVSVSISGKTCDFSKVVGHANVLILVRRRIHVLQKL